MHFNIDFCIPATCYCSIKSSVPIWPCRPPASCLDDGSIRGHTCDLANTALQQTSLAAPSMSGVGGISGLHSVEGICDLCGEKCDTETQELNALSCTFAPNCPEEASLYHQECLERYLKNIRCEK